jgi:small multidrug resistance pump
MLAANPILALGLAMAVFLVASSCLRVYAGGAGLWLLGVALMLYCVGNLLMVPVMAANGLAVAMSVSAVLQLLLATLVAVIAFGERPMMVQWAGIALGVVAVVLILWPQIVRAAD